MQIPPKDEHQNTYPCYLLFKLSSVGGGELIVRTLFFLDFHSQSNLFIAMNSCTNKFFQPCKDSFLNPTRAYRACILRGAVIKCEYDTIAQAVEADPQVLTDRMSYPMSYWELVGICEAKKLRELSAFEFAHLVGDENLLEMFARLGSKHLNPSDYKNIASLQQESYELLVTLGEQFNVMADLIEAEADDSALNKIEDIIDGFSDHTPTWVLMLIVHFYHEGVHDESKAASYDIMSSGFRSRAKNASDRACASIFISSAISDLPERLDMQNAAAKYLRCLAVRIIATTQLQHCEYSSLAQS